MPVLPTNDPALGNVGYSFTTFYHWPQFSANLTDRDIKVSTGSDFTDINGPIIFQRADALDRSKQQVRVTSDPVLHISSVIIMSLPFPKCLIDNSFHASTREGSECFINPVLCEKGLSFSIFYLSSYDEDETAFFNESYKFEREYMISTG